MAFSYVGCCWWVNGGIFLCRLLLVGERWPFLMQVVAGGLTVAFSYVDCCWWVNGGLLLCRLLLLG